MRIIMAILGLACIAGGIFVFVTFRATDIQLIVALVLIGFGAVFIGISWIIREVLYLGDRLEDRR